MKRRTIKRIGQAAELLSDKKNILVFTGAGLDEDSGVPTFDERKNDSIKDWGITRWRDDPKWRAEVWSMYGMFAELTPHAGHDAIEELGWSGLTCAHVTTNVTGLSPDAIELCGSATRIVMDDTGLMRPDVVFIGEGLDDEATDEYDEACDEMDALLVVGASPLIAFWWHALIVANLNGLPIVVINNDPEDIWTENADVLIKARAINALPALVNTLTGC